MNFYSTIFFAFLLFISCATYVDELSSIQSSVVTVAPNSASNNLVLGSNSYPITFANAFTAAPTVVAALCQFSSTMTTKYATKLSKQSITTSGFTLGILTGSNWNYLSYNIFASIVDSVIVGNYQFTALGPKSDNIAIIKTQHLSQYPLSNKLQTSFKPDIFIMGFDLTVSDASSSFLLNATFNYGSEDKTKGSYLTYNDYIYTQTSYPTFVSTGLISIQLNWFGDLSSLQLAQISHPFVVATTAVYSFTGGYNTVSVTSAKYNITLFDPKNSKNNLGSLNPTSFYGFTSINLTPTSTVDANISILYGYYTNLTSSGSTINSLSSSYFFYQPFENSIVDHIFTQFIESSIPEWALGKIIPGNTLTRQYYKYLLSGGSPNRIPNSDFTARIGSHYLMTIEILDQQGCYSGSDFVKEKLQIGFLNYDQIINTTNTDAFFINPNQPCTSSTKIQFTNPIEKWYRYFQLQIAAIKTQTIGGYFTLYDQTNIFYLKNVKFYQLSPNAILDPMITEVTQNAFFYYYKVTPTTQKGFFNELPFVSISNALMVYPYSGNPVTVKSISLAFTIGVTYTLSFYILDSAGNLASSFKSPVLLINFGGTTITTQTATLDKPFCSPAFNLIQTLTTLVDKFYLKITIPITPTSASNILEFVLSDSSSDFHLYAMRSITLKHIEYFDPVARNNVPSCPHNTYLTSNTLPPACQACYIQNKIDNGSQCICASNITYLNQFSVCVKCGYSCLYCDSETRCTGCITGRNLDTILFKCNCTIGTYDDGVNPSCAICVYSCQNCTTNAKKCTSCISGRTLDTTLFTCDCTIGTYDDGVNPTCAKCVYSCQNCSTNAKKCTSCISGRTLDTTLFTCDCKIGTFDDGVNASCAKCVYSCQNCVSNANKCTSCLPGRTLDTSNFMCNCAIGTYDDGANTACLTCHYSCQNCIKNANKCTTCLTGRTLDTNTFMCNCLAGSFDYGQKSCVSCSQLCATCVSKPTQCTSCTSDRQLNITSSTCECKRGSYENGTSTDCKKCNQTCGSCSKNAYNCTSCPIGSVLDTTTSACICGARYFNDTTPVCGKCSNKCGNCSGNANKCTSCLNESGSTFDPDTFTCKCQNGYSFSPSGICTKNHPIYIPNFHAQQFEKTFKLKAYLTAINNSSLNATDILNSSLCTLYYNQSSRKLDSVNLTLNIIQIILLSNNLVQFIVQNPSFNLINVIVLLNFNNPNINQTSIQFTISQLYSTQTMKSISTPTSSSVTSTVLLTILLFIMLILYVLGYKHNHTISFIQKISFLRFNLPIASSAFAFLYSLKYSYYAYGANALQSLLSSTYLQSSNGNFYFVDQDANILRNVGIPILFSITIIFLRLIGLLLFKSSSQTTGLKKYYYRTIEYVQKTIMFPIIFFGIAEMTFANLYGKADTADPSIYNLSLAFSVIYVIYFAILVIATGFSKQISNYAKLELAGEYVFSIFDSIIIIQTYYTNNVLALIITIVIKCAYELFLKYTYATISKLDLMKIIVTVFQIALIGILVNSSTSLTSIQALFIIVVVIDLLYVLGTTILQVMDKKKKHDQIPGEIHESNKEIVSGKIPIVESMNTINP